jgi:hypothetical protein
MRYIDAVDEAKQYSYEHGITTRVFQDEDGDFFWLPADVDNEVPSRLVRIFT